ncbi:copper transporter 5.1 [Hevea brasiliensis]|uniref:copper transporter 5.1 n=1 Tax=Hevea brasiliensis TaxID=3981 RepID=UPI0025E002AD|nr:copper transporter 5.1 [Hevea brasiliensis]
MMHMTFYWGRQVTLLVDSWRTTTWLGYALTLLVCVVASALYQFLENLRVRMRFKVVVGTGGLAAEEPLLQSKTGRGKLSAARVAQAVLFGMNSAIGYLLMLAVMSFNGGVFVAIVMGLGIGYLLFSEDENFALVDSPCACA